MLGMTWADGLAVAVYFGSWLGYHLLLEHERAVNDGVNYIMKQHRREWMRRMGARETRIIDTQITASLQNGSAFFASASMIALGATVGMLRSTDDALRLFETLPFGATPSRAVWELKLVGLAVMFGYTFFKFGWSYRLFNYSAILIGATPEHDDPDAAARDRAVERAAKMNIAAGQHFARGQRALFFAVAYLGWFVSPWLFIVTTLLVVMAMSRRQFSSDARDALRE
jgi:uncharacterized membrane protein